MLSETCWSFYFVLNTNENIQKTLTSTVGQKKPYEGQCLPFSNIIPNSLFCVQHMKETQTSYGEVNHALEKKKKKKSFCLVYSPQNNSKIKKFLDKQSILSSFWN